MLIIKIFVHEGVTAPSDGKDPGAESRATCAKGAKISVPPEPPACPPRHLIPRPLASVRSAAQDLVARKVKMRNGVNIVGKCSLLLSEGFELV